MGLAMLIVWASIIIGALAGVAVYRICKWLGRPDIGAKFGVATGVLWTVLWIGPVGSAAFWLVTDVKIGLNGPPADAAVAFLDVPAGQASDVCYRRSYPNYYADFQMSEGDFLAWMKSQQWVVKRFKHEEWDSVSFVFEGSEIGVGTDVNPIRRWGSEDFVFVLDGYCHWHAYSVNSSTTVIYDLTAGRVYVQL